MQLDSTFLSLFPKQWLLLGILLLTTRARAQSEFDGPPINYSSKQTSDPVARFAQRIARGEAKLEWDRNHGWLPAFLTEMKIPRSSQTLVFSKTSLQFSHITPNRPRALYFNDDVYVGWVNGGNVLEVVSVDKEQGSIFYTISQSPGEPRVVRDNGECLACHENGRTQRVPGLLVRSVFAKSSGHPDFRLGTTTTDHRTPLKDRFGGWYVTGSHGAMRHRGNIVITKSDDNDPLDREAGANLVKLPKSVSVEDYLEPTSDIVALMILEHQTQMHNRITKASFSSRRALHDQLTTNRALDRPADYQTESTTRRINSAVEEMLRFMFFCDEYQLTSRVSGSSEFVNEFSKRGPKDKKKRSLRDLDLESRLLKYPLSYMVYSDSFRSLPAPTLKQAKLRMMEILTGQDDSDLFSHLSQQDRANILAILQQTHFLFAPSSESDSDGPP